MKVPGIDQQDAKVWRHPRGVDQVSCTTDKEKVKRRGTAKEIQYKPRIRSYPPSKLRGCDPRGMGLSQQCRSSPILPPRHSRPKPPSAR